MYPKPKKQKKISKTEVWYRVMHEEIIPQFDKWGIRVCEIKTDYCKQTMYLGFAHTKKRRDIHTPEDLRRVVLACQPCHEIVEYKCQATYGVSMTEYLDRIIQKRNELLQKQGLL